MRRSESLWDSARWAKPEVKWRKGSQAEAGKGKVKVILILRLMSTGEAT